MRSFPTFCIVALAAIAVGADVFKEEDVEVIQDEKLFQEVYSCLMDQAPCPDKLKKLKELVPGYVRTKCADCSPKEKELFEKNVKIISEKYPKEFKNLMDKFGPSTQN